MQTIFKKSNKKGFTLMELLVTVILVSILASYGVYYYTNVMQEGKYNAAKGKLAALGGATARFILESSNSNMCGGYFINSIDTNEMTGVCNLHMDAQRYMYNVFLCGYAERNLGIIDDFQVSFGCPHERNCGSYESMTVFMKPVAGQDDIVPACAYFDPDTDRVVEVRSGN